MPFLSEAASAIKSRFGFHDHSESVSLVQSTPDLLKSAAKDSVVHSSAFRSIGDWEDDGNSAAAPSSSAQSFEFCEDPSFWNDHNVQVIIRMRPLSNTEISLQGYGKCVRQESCQTITWTGHPESRFTFDLVADENVSQEKLFKVAGLPMVENCMGGYNSCMFAYGQTGSGKTHTMLGDIEGGTRRHSVNCGMTPRIFEHLFSRIQKEKEVRRDEKLKFTCKCSFLEIYNEQILDLLDPSSNNLQIREDSKKGVYVENLKEVEVTNARDVIQQLIQGAANRKVAATNMNRASSRSHSVFTCNIESQWESQGVTHFRFARLNLVDLAGSERQKSSGAEGERLKEATNINKSLSTLGLVIMNLVSISNGKSLHVPYRDSKLTFLLQDSLGGNSKTIIIANISPSICCSLETLSTLKFAQRAKFIKNNAIVNEDASGDVIAMRIQIQQLKKEVSRLRGLVAGVETQDVDTSVVSFPGSPGSFKWEGTHGSFSPLTTGKRKKDYDIALVGAFRREKDKDMALQSLRDANQAAMKLAKQREDEIQGLKMRLRFREAGIKRLEAVASGKILAETHLLNEKEELLKEIEVLRAQVDRNQEVTRFAMENLQLKEEIRRLKSFYEEGERETMNEQIMELKNKLLEALDWKFMHETNLKTDSDSVMEDAQGDGNLISQQETSPKSRWQSSLREENEFLRIQAIQNQAEMDTIRKQLQVCLQEKELLERHVDDLTAKFEQEKSQANKEGREQMNIPSTTDVPVINISDQQELKALVDAIAAASQREAEAHETAIVLSKENEELRLKLKALIEDNSKLIELYEQAAAENSGKNVDKGENGQEISSMVDNGCQILEIAKEETELKSEVENLQHQLSEMNEENEKLMTLYERAMQERDDLKRTLAGRVETKGEMECPEKLVEVDAGKSLSNEETISHEAQEIGKSEHVDKPTICGSGLCSEDDGQGEKLLEEKNEDDIQDNSDMDIDVSNITANLSEELNCAKEKLEKVDEQISDVSDAVRNLSSFDCSEKAMVEVDKLSTEIEVIEHDIHVKRQHFESLKLQLSEAQERRTLTDKKLSALKYSLSNFSSSMSYFEQREARARAGVNDLTSHLNRKKEALAALQASKEGLVNAQKKNQECEAELIANIASLKTKLEEENRKREGEKVLFAIDNTHNTDSTLKNWHLSGKATELLKLEEEKPKLQSEMNLSQEKLRVKRKELGNLNKKVTNVESKIEAVQLEIQHGLKISEEKELAFQRVMKEKEMILEFRDNGVSEIGNMTIELQQCVFECDLKECEIKIIEEELQVDFARAQELQSARVIAVNNKNSIVSSVSHSSMLKRIEEGMENLRAFIVEIKLLLDGISHAT